VKRVGVYCRVSTDTQNVEMQLNQLRPYVAQRGFEIFKEYIDVGQSGAKEQRPQLNELMDAARKRLFDVVLVYRFDRFARSSKMLALALNEFQSLGIDFISYSENIDTSSPMGKAMFTIISAMAELERSIIAERVTAGIANARKKGKILGRPVTRDDSAILKLREEGHSIRKIASLLQTSIASVQRGIVSKNS